MFSSANILPNSISFFPRKTKQNKTHTHTQTKVDFITLSTEPVGPKVLSVFSFCLFVNQSGDTMNYDRDSNHKRQVNMVYWLVTSLVHCDVTSQSTQLFSLTAFAICIYIYFFLQSKKQVNPVQQPMNNSNTNNKLSHNLFQIFTFSNIWHGCKFAINMEMSFGFIKVMC